MSSIPTSNNENGETVSKSVPDFTNSSDHAENSKEKEQAEIENSTLLSENEESSASATESSEVPTMNQKDFVQLSAKLICRIDTILRFISSPRNNYSQKVEEYLQRKTQLLFSQDYKAENVYSNQNSTDFFPASQKSVLLFNDFFRKKQDILWTKKNKFSHICLICNRSIKYKSSLNDHLNVHYEHFHVCKICSLRVASNKALQKHMHLKHNEMK